MFLFHVTFHFNKIKIKIIDLDFKSVYILNLIGYGDYFVIFQGRHSHIHRQYCIYKRIHYILIVFLYICCVVLYKDARKKNPI